MYVYMFMCMRGYMWRQEVQSDCRPLLLPALFFSESLTEAAADLVSPAGRGAAGVSAFSSTRVTGAHHHVQLFCLPMRAEDLSSVPCACVASFTNQASSPALKEHSEVLGPDVNISGKQGQAFINLGTN